jgi:hypothetical protein
MFSIKPIKQHPLLNVFALMFEIQHLTIYIILEGL